MFPPALIFGALVLSFGWPKPFDKLCDRGMAIAARRLALAAFVASLYCIAAGLNMSRGCVDPFADVPAARWGGSPPGVEVLFSR